MDKSQSSNSFNADDDSQDSVDPELIQIFVEESTEIFDELENFWNLLDKAKSDKDLYRNIHRELHTLKGSARMVKQTSISELAHEMEEIFQVLLEGELELTDDAYHRLSKAEHFLQRMCQHLKKSMPLPDHRPVLKELKDLLGSKGQIEVRKIDGYLLELFLQNSNELMISIRERIQLWGSNLKDLGPVEEIVSDLQELRQVAQPLEHRHLQDLIDIIKSIYQELLKCTLESKVELKDLMDRAHQQIESMSAAIQNHHYIQCDSKILTSLMELVKTFKKSDAMPEMEGSAPPPLLANDFVRIRTSILEHLSGLSGENSIACVHLGQQLPSIHHQLKQARLSLKEIFNHLKRLGSRTDLSDKIKQETQEAKVEDESTSGFDSLEMDHYTEVHELTCSLEYQVQEVLNALDEITHNTELAETILRRQLLMADGLQGSLLSTRMISFEQVVPRLRRMVKQLSHELNKVVNFKIDFVEGSLDRDVLEKIIPPLEHMLRNALDHGVEPSDVRKKLGKPGTASIVLQLTKVGNDVVIELTDDGAGINLDKIREKAIKLGFLKKEELATDEKLLGFILRPGFTTRDHVTEISGRGIGMDVVNHHIKQLGGSLAIHSKQGKGTHFVLTLPFTTSQNNGLLFCVGEETYAIQLSSIVAVSRLPKGEFLKLSEHDQNTFYYSKKSYPLFYLGDLIGNVGHRLLKSEKIRCSVPVLLLRGSGFQYAVYVDQLLGRRKMVVKSMGSDYNHVRSIAGASISADGQVVMILDAVHLGVKANQRCSGQLSNVVAEAESKIRSLRRAWVMVVDDSVTVRKVTGDFLKRHGYHVILAKDGLDALHALQDQKPDVILLDVEMPRMDGFSFAKRIRQEEETKHIPIIVITSRSGQKHREKALEYGIERFLGKPYQNEELLGAIEQLLDQRKGEEG